MIPPQQRQPSGRAISLTLSRSLSLSRSLGDAINLDGGCQERRDRTMRVRPLALCLPAVSLLQKSTFFTSITASRRPSARAWPPILASQQLPSCARQPTAYFGRRVRGGLLFVCLFLIAPLTLCYPKRPPSLTLSVSHRCVSRQWP